MPYRENIRLIIGGIVLGVPALMVLFTVFVPDYVTRTRATLKARPWPSFLVGLVNAAFFLALAWVLVSLNIHVLGVIGLIIGLIILPLFIVVGLVASAALVGERAWSLLSERPSTLLGALLLGAVVVIPVLLVPVVGWLAFLILLLVGLGAGILALFERPRSEEEQEPV